MLRNKFLIIDILLHLLLKFGDPILDLVNQSHSFLWASEWSKGYAGSVVACVFYMGFIRDLLLYFIITSDQKCINYQGYLLDEARLRMYSRIVGTGSAFPVFWSLFCLNLSLDDN